MHNNNSISNFKAHKPYNSNIILNLSIKFYKFWYEYIWRYLPDYLAVACGILMSTVGILNEKSVGRYTYWIAIPIIIILFVIIVFVQVNNERNNLSIRFIETWPAMLLGYCSYSLCKCLLTNSFSYYCI